MAAVPPTALALRIKQKFPDVNEGHSFYYMLYQGFPYIAHMDRPAKQRVPHEYERECREFWERIVSRMGSDAPTNKEQCVWDCITFVTMAMQHKYTDVYLQCRDEYTLNFVWDMGNNMIHSFFNMLESFANPTARHPSYAIDMFLTFLYKFKPNATAMKNQDFAASVDYQKMLLRYHESVLLQLSQTKDILISQHNGRATPVGSDPVSHIEHAICKQIEKRQEMVERLTKNGVSVSNINLILRNTSANQREQDGVVEYLSNNKPFLMGQMFRTEESAAQTIPEIPAPRPCSAKRPACQLSEPAPKKQAARLPMQPPSFTFGKPVGPMQPPSEPVRP
jgi:hypothetical protein